MTIVDATAEHAEVHQLCTRLHLAPDPRAVGFVRRLMVADLTAQEVGDAVADDAALVLSELTSNAIVHGRPHRCGHVEVSWCIDDDVLRISVTDGGPPEGAADVAARPASRSSLHGRGLAIVAHVCENWRATTDDGVRVTAELAC